MALVLGMIVMNTMDDRVLSDGPLATLYGGNIKEEILTVNGRVELWKTVVPLLDSTVLLGFGLDGAREILLGAFDWSGNSHNAVLELILAAGMPGALLFVLGWGIAIWRATKLPPGWRSKVLAVHVYLIITSIASPIWTTSQYISVFYLTVINATSRESFTAPAWGRWSARMRLFWSNSERPRLWASPDAPPAG